MADKRMLGPPRVRGKLADLSRRSLNFDPAELEQAGPGWEVTDLRQALAHELPGPPLEHGSWEIARRLMRGYEFADPSIVRAYYDPELPLAGRNMLLKLQTLGLAHVYVGVRVGDVYELAHSQEGREVRVWGWNYGTLEGHVEMGQMDWEVWKWLDSGEVEFRVHSVSRPAPIANPFVRVGFRLLRGHEREAFLRSTRHRMRTLVEVALEHDGNPGPLWQTAVQSTARRSPQADAAHDEIAHRVRAADGRA